MCVCACVYVCVDYTVPLHITVASEIPGRTGQQCMHRWQKALMPGIKKGRWTAEEDEVCDLFIGHFVTCLLDLCVTYSSSIIAIEAGSGYIWSW